MRHSESNVVTVRGIYLRRQDTSELASLRMPWGVRSTFSSSKLIQALEGGAPSWSPHSPGLSDIPPKKVVCDRIQIRFRNLRLN